MPGLSPPDQSQISFEVRHRHMKTVPNSLFRTALVVLAFVLVIISAIELIPSSNAVAVSANQTSSATTTRNVPLADTTTTTTTSTTTTTPPSTEAITAGASRGQCLTPNIPTGTYGLANLQSVITAFDNLTGTNVTCLSAYVDTAQTWAQWESPWVSRSSIGFSAWVAEEPNVRQLVVAVNLIPDDLKNVQNPTSWERACASGQYDSHATALGRSLVAAGLQNSVIRLGVEMNGAWEPDFMGTTLTQQRLWAKCFDNEVTGLRRAEGEKFLIDWNPNACWAPYPYAHYYPGNAYVDIMGLDLYDVGCLTPYTRLTFTQLVDEPFGLRYFEAFARSKNKAMSLPEWGLSTLPSGDDPSYISGIGHLFETENFAFEAYFDTTTAGGANTGSLPLGPTTPLAVAAYRVAFGS